MKPKEVSACDNCYKVGYNRISFMELDSEYEVTW